jgi:hypothetical protein
MIGRPIARSLPLQIAACLVFAGCANDRPLGERLAAAETAVIRAEDSGAAERDFIGLTEAKNKLKQAEDAARRNDDKAARRLAEEAEFDAREASRLHHGPRDSR